MNPNKPSLGRIVRYTPESLGTGELAALITEVKEFDVVNLAVFASNGVLFMLDVPHGKVDEPYSWHWPLIG